jgi:hypothetical protein
MPFVDITGRCIPVANVDHREEFAWGTLAPDPIALGGRSVTRGLRESVIVKRLGDSFRVVEQPVRRSKRQDAEYVGDLMAAYPTTMHFYILGELQLQGTGGWFKVLEWTFPTWGTLRAYFRAMTESGPYVARLLHVKPDSVALEKVTWVTGSHLCLTRAGSPKMTWDIDRNSLMIE